MVKTYIVRDLDYKVKAVRDVKVLQRLHSPVNKVVSCIVVLEATEKLLNERD
jgi:hypothetical protein